MPIKNSALDSELSLKNLESFGKKTDEPTFISKLSNKVQNGDIVLTLGAGDITLLGPKILKYLNEY